MGGGGVGGGRVKERLRGGPCKGGAGGVAKGAVIISWLLLAPPWLLSCRADFLAKPVVGKAY